MVRKFDYCKKELISLIKKMIEGNYYQSAKFIYNHMTQTGVEVDIEGIKEPSFEVFLKENNIEINKTDA